jgi:hypothetical protein
MWQARYPSLPYAPIRTITSLTRRARPVGHQGMDC